MEHSNAIFYTYDEDISNELSNNGDSDFHTSRCEQQHIDIDTNKSMKLSDGDSQDRLELLNERRHILHSAVILRDVV